MSGLFSPNFRVLNEPRYFGRPIRTIIRCLSSCLSMVITFAGMLVILALSTLIATESLERLQTMYLFRFDKCNCTELAGRFTWMPEEDLLPFFPAASSLVAVIPLHLIAI